MGTNNFSYRYDPIGNRTVATNNGAVTEYQANALNQYSQITNNHSPITPAYDLDGNIVALRSLGEGGDGYKDWAFAWDAENRMTGASNEAVVANYSYDYMSRRYRKIVNGVTNNFVYDGWNLIREISSAGVTNTYVWGLDLSGTQQGAGGIGGMLSVTRNGSTYFPCCDANGNITDYVDASGAVLAHRDYDAYGNTVASSGPMVNDFSFWFSSKYLDQETGLYYYGYRQYSPEMGRWLSRDPIAEEGHTLLRTRRTKRRKAVEDEPPNRVEEKSALYLFIFNNSVDSVDPLGLQRFDWVGPEACRYYSHLCVTDPSDTYACSTKDCCEWFGNSPTARCIRGCLIAFDMRNCAALTGEARNRCRRLAHWDCYSRCNGEALGARMLCKVPAECKDAMDAVGGMHPW